MKLIILTSYCSHTLGQLKNNTYECKDVLGLVCFSPDFLHTTQLLQGFDDFAVMIEFVFRCSLVYYNYGVT